MFHLFILLLALSWVISVSSVPTTQPTGVPSPLSAPDTNKAPTKAPLHVFDTFAPTRAPTPPMSTSSPSIMNDTTVQDVSKQQEGDDNYMVVIIIGTVGGMIVFACCAILFYWHTYTRVQAAAPSGGGLLDLELASCFSGAGGARKGAEEEKIDFMQL